MNHLIVTKFNVGKPEEEWTEKRINIFRKFTVQSINNQTEKRFKWIILIDPNTTEFHIDKINRLVPYALLIKDRRIGKHVDDVPKLDEYCDDKNKPLIITRLANDDMLSVDAISNIQKTASLLPKDNCSYIIDGIYRVCMTEDLKSFNIINTALRANLKKYGIGGFYSDIASVVRPVNLKLEVLLESIRHRFLHQYIIANRYFLSNISSCAVVHDTNMSARVNSPNPEKHHNWWTVPARNITNEVLLWLEETYGFNRKEMNDTIV